MRTATLLVFAALVFAVPANAAPMFVPLGDLGGADFFSAADGVSADGSVVVGRSHRGLNGAEAFRWTAGEGMVGIGDLPGGNGYASQASDVSADGSVVVGTSDYSGSRVQEAFRWTSAGGMVGIGALPNGSSSAAAAVSADGSVVVGRSFRGSGYEAFRWTEGSGMAGLGQLPGTVSGSQAHGVSADGSVVVGDGYRVAAYGSGQEAFRWTPGTGMIGIGTLTGGTFSTALGVSADGLVVVGSSSTVTVVFPPPFISTNEAFRWTESDGMVGLGTLPGGLDSSANGASDDGSTIVGYAYSIPSGYEAFLWKSSDGMRSLQDMLVGDFGLDLTGWRLQHATAISADGQAIVGYGTNPNGQTEAWLAMIPEPGTALLVTAGVLGLASSRRRRASCR